MKYNKLLIPVLLSLSLLGSGCGHSSSTTPNTENTTQVAKQTLKIGVMPAVDTAPIYLAKEKGYFDDLGLDLDIQLFTNAAERQTALQTHTIDGALTDLIAVATNVDGGFDLKATTLTDGVFPVLVKKDYEEKKEIKVGMMEVSVSNFLIDEWLGQDYSIEKVFINDIPSRLEMIKNGEVDMGLFPEPMATNGAMNGLEKRIYTPEDGMCPNVMAFTNQALEEKSEAIALFHKGFNEGVKACNEKPEEARDILVQKLNLKPEIKDQFILPTYTSAHLPADTYNQKIIDWIQESLKKDISITPADLVNEDFIN